MTNKQKCENDDAARQILARAKVVVETTAKAWQELHKELLITQCESKHKAALRQQPKRLSRVTHRNRFYSFADAFTG